MNNYAQIHVFEVIIVSGMLLMALFFVRTFDISPSITTIEENELEILGIGILTSLEGVPDNLEQYPSLLARYATAEYIDEFTDYINRSVPKGTLYGISWINISMLNQHPDWQIDDPDHPITEILYKAPVEIGKEARVSRIVVIDGLIYIVALTLYFTLR